LLWGGECGCDLSVWTPGEYQAGESRRCIRRGAAEGMGRLWSSGSGRKGGGRALLGGLLVRNVHVFGVWKGHVAGRSPVMVQDILISLGDHHLRLDLQLVCSVSCSSPHSLSIILSYFSSLALLLLSRLSIRSREAGRVLSRLVHHPRNRHSPSVLHNDPPLLPSPALYQVPRLAKDHQTSIRCHSRSHLVQKRLARLYIPFSLLSETERSLASRCSSDEEILYLKSCAWAFTSERATAVCDRLGPGMGSVPIQVGSIEAWYGLANDGVLVRGIA